MVDIPSVQELFCLSGKVALVTGARNLGYFAAESLADLGAAVVVTTRDQQRSDRIARQLSLKKNVIAVGMRLEATDEDNWRSVVTSIIDKFGAIDILINNAGGRNPETTKCIDYNDMSRYFLDDRSLVSWTHTLDTNLTSAFLGCKTIVPYMKKQYHGKIVNISSIDGIVGRDLELYRDTGLSPTIPDYLASKAAIISLTRGLAVVLAQHNIHVNCISPGGFYRGQPNEFVRKYCEKVPLKRMGKDETDLKGAIAFLCSSASDYVTGHNLVVDGGWTAW